MRVVVLARKNVAAMKTGARHLLRSVGVLSPSTGTQFFPSAFANETTLMVRGMGGWEEQGQANLHVSRAEYYACSYFCEITTYVTLYMKQLTKNCQKMPKPGQLVTT